MTGTELILSGNGPGELTGWIAPVARAARRLAAARGVVLRLTLALSPSQFAGGRELEVVRRWGLFDHIIPPATVARLALGSGRLDPVEHGALVHLGGELWISARLAGRLRVPAAALVETTLVARRHRPFARIFAVSPEVAERLASRAVPPSKISVSGDPRSDAVLARSEAPSAGPAPDAGYVVSFLPGSRDRFFTVLAPYFLAVAGALADLGVRAAAQVIVSEFLSPDVVDAARAAASPLPQVPVRWITRDPWPALIASDLVVTIPGTNTLELAMLGVPFAVVLEESGLHAAPLEGAAEWLTRVPALGPALRRLVVGRALRRLRFVALPNALAGRLVVPEWVGRWTPPDLAKRVAELLSDPSRRETIRRELRGLGLSTPGAAERIAARLLAMAEGNIGKS